MHQLFITHFAGCLVFLTLESLLTLELLVNFVRVACNWSFINAEMEEGYLVLNLLPPPPKLNVVFPLSCTDIVQIYI